jgi:pimeloyl-ACP methyl ester carboxylesterase
VRWICLVTLVRLSILLMQVDPLQHRIAATEGSQMTKFVLVHGAWQTASTWDLVIPKLRAVGHEVWIPPLTGLENDANLLTPAIGLQTHIDDVVGFLTHENLQDVTLVGHSYAGMIITGVAENALHRLNRLVYVDAFIPRDGQSALNLLPETVVQSFRQQAENTGAGWRLKAGEGQLDMWGLKAGPARDFVRSRLSDFSLNCFREAIQIPENAAAKLPRKFIACVAEGYPARRIFQQFGDRAKQESWDYDELATGHDCHVEMPDAFVSSLLAKS